MEPIDTHPDDIEIFVQASPEYAWLEGALVGATNETSITPAVVADGDPDIELGAPNCTVASLAGDDTTDVDAGVEPFTLAVTVT